MKTMLILGLLASSAGATTTVTYSGTVASGYDTVGVFGTPETDLTGKAFTAIFQIDTTVPTSSDPNYSQVLSGGGYPLQIFAKVVVGGNSSYLFGKQGGYADVSYTARASGPSLSSIEDGASNNDAALGFYLFSPTTRFLPSASLFTPFHYDAQAGDEMLGSFVQYGVPDTSAMLTISSIDVTEGGSLIEPSTVPEPASWGLLIAGFGLVGFASRRSRANTETA